MHKEQEIVLIYLLLHKCYCSFHHLAVHPLKQPPDLYEASKQVPRCNEFLPPAAEGGRAGAAWIPAVSIVKCTMYSTYGLEWLICVNLTMSTSWRQMIPSPGVSWKLRTALGLGYLPLVLLHFGCQRFLLVHSPHTRQEIPSVPLAPYPEVARSAHLVCAGVGASPPCPWWVLHQSDRWLCTLPLSSASSFPPLMVLSILTQIFWYVSVMSVSMEVRKHCRVFILLSMILPFLLFHLIVNLTLPPWYCYAYVGGEVKTCIFNCFRLSELFSKARKVIDQVVKDVFFLLTVTRVLKILNTFHLSYKLLLESWKPLVTSSSASEYY